MRAVVAWAGLISSAPAHAANDEPTYALNWSRGDGARECITTPALAKAVEARLGRSVFVSPAAAQFMLDARIEGGPSQWSATISLQDRDGHRVGQRDLTSTEKDCRALDQSLSLMLALAIDPNATLAVAGTPVATSLPPPAPPAPAEAPPPVAVARPVDTPVVPKLPAATAPERVATAYTEASLRVSFGMLPGGAVPGAEVAAMVPIHESWIARAGAAAWLPAQETGAEGGVLISQFSASLGMCGRIRGTAAFLLLCAGMEPGLLVASGYGFNHSIETARRFTLMAGPSAKVGVHLVGQLWGQLGGDLLVPIIRRQFYYLKADNSSVEVFRSAAITGAVSASVLLAFP